MKTKPSEKGNHILHEFPLHETCECQPPRQRWDGEWNEVCARPVLLFLHRESVAELEVLEIWEESDKIEDLPARPSGFPESKESEARHEVPKELLNVWHETWYIEVVYSELLDVRKCGKIAQGVPAKLFRGEVVGRIMVRADAKSLDEWK